MSDTQTAHRVHRRGSWPKAEGTQPETITLDYESRFLRRKRIVTDGGTGLLVDLAETTSLEEGDALETMEGRLIEVRAAPDALIEIRADGASLARLAWHIGNRHTPAQIDHDRILIREDHVMRDMLRRLGAELGPVTGAFKPEGGAYGHGRTLGHHHGSATSDPAHVGDAHHHHHSTDG